MASSFPPERTPPSSQVGELARIFLRLGLTAFGGPAAHIAIMREEFVARRKWLSDQQFLDLLGATNLIPGPNSTEVAIHLGYLRAGLPGLVTAGICFVLPAMLMVMGLAWMYTRFGSTPQAAWLLYGIKPVIIAIIFQALWNLGKRAVRGPLTAAVGAIVLVLYLLGINELLLLFTAGLLVMLIKNLPQGRIGDRLSGLRGLPVLLTGLGSSGLAGAQVAAQTPFHLSLLFFTFLKIGSVLYGGGYVLLAFLRSDFVERLGWLTEDQLLNAIAIGQVTPGPLFTSATFIGYLLGGAAGAVVATIGIFLPAFVVVALTNPIIPRLRQSRWAGALLDGVNVSSLGLMAGVTLQLTRSSLVDSLTVLLALLSAVLLLRYKLNTTYLVLIGAFAGLASQVL